MEFKDFLSKQRCLKFLKWVEIIQQRNKATEFNAMYILERGKKYCEVIFVDDAGNKRSVGGVSTEEIEADFAKIDLSNLTQEAKDVWKVQLGALSPYDLAVQQGFPGDLDEWLESLKGAPGPTTILNFKVDDDMNLIMEQSTNSNIEFHIDSNGNLIVNS